MASCSGGPPHRLQERSPYLFRLLQFGDDLFTPAGEFDLEDIRFLDRVGKGFALVDEPDIVVVDFGIDHPPFPRRSV